MSTFRGLIHIIKYPQPLSKYTDKIIKRCLIGKWIVSFVLLFPCLVYSINERSICRKIESDFITALADYKKADEALSKAYSYLVKAGVDMNKADKALSKALADDGKTFLANLAKASADMNKAVEALNKSFDDRVKADRALAEADRALSKVLADVRMRKSNVYTFKVYVVLSKVKASADVRQALMALSKAYAMVCPSNTDSC